MKLKLILSAIGAFGLLFLTNTSCQKKTDCIAIVNCVDTLGAPKGGVDVRLFANVKTTTGGTVTADLKANAITGSDKQASFTFKLPAIYDIKCTSGSYTTASIIKLEEGKSVDKTVTIR